jgi:hypothetical protein
VFEHVDPANVVALARLRRGRAQLSQPVCVSLSMDVKPGAVIRRSGATRDTPVIPRSAATWDPFRRCTEARKGSLAALGMTKEREGLMRTAEGHG